MSEAGHIPVLLDEFLSFFEDLKIKVFVDGTLGAGGHSLALLEAHPEIEKLIGFDQDSQAIEIAKKRLKSFENKVVILEKNYCEMHEELKTQNISEVDGIFLDIGVSSMQLDQAERGFSFSKDGPLDMRMDRSCSLTAAEIVNTWSEKDLADIFREYGDVAKWRLAAKKIVEERKKRHFKTTKDLVNLLSPFLRKSSKKSIHPLTLVFQALRIAVNNELKVLGYTLPKVMPYLRSGGRLGVISFHSGEDRIVKNSFRALSQKQPQMGDEVKGPLALMITKKPVGPTDEECRRNPRSRSAKMRVLERI